MKITNKKSLSSGFTLVELLVSMSITLILVGVLIYLATVSTDAYKSSREEVRASRQGQQAMSVIAKDFESLQIRRGGNDFEWLYVGEETSSLSGPSGKEIPNTSRLIFFTAVTDRYNGEIGVSGVDKGGDVSAVSYRLVYRDQISDTDNDEHAVFSLYRNLADPDEAFDLLAEPDLLESSSSSVFSDSEDLSADNFLVENIYEFTLTFIVLYVDEAGEDQVERVVIAHNSSSASTEFRVKGDKLEITPANSDLESGVLIGAEISISVLTDQGVTLAKSSGLQQEDLLREHSYHYTKKVVIPRS